MSQIFKIGDQVYHCMLGWGTVIDISVFINVKFEAGSFNFYDEGKYYESDIQPTLSFTEYTLDGFSQERPVEMPNVGEEIMIEIAKDRWALRTVIGYKKGGIVFFKDTDGNTYSVSKFKRLR